MKDILPIDCKVIMRGDFPGWITAITIRGPKDRPAVTYEVRWWDGMSLRSDWFTEDEITPQGPDAGRTFLGFSQ